MGRGGRGEGGEGERGRGRGERGERGTEVERLGTGTPYGGTVATSVSNSL